MEVNPETDKNPVQSPIPVICRGSHSSSVFQGCYGSYIPRHRRHQHAKMFSVSQRVVGNRGGMYELNGRVPRSPDTREIENVQDTV
ncbi:hypothetical protein TNIN_206751 [Trichonephila inaurata madagascariensis]|uniref:Uncharacterized protein n=1 Tax=Trichonephila inaurata madagascariensis TaxID=2747483 RepID=A0A8X7BXN9_9ARAC|nr:hypothetical protein TNIN_206751 [Trichonephila inaurata madagascariensis]